MMGWNLDNLLDFPQICDETGVTNAMKLERVDEIGRKIFLLWQTQTYAVEKIREVLQQVAEEEAMDLSQNDELNRCMTFVKQEIYPRLENTVDEIHSLMD